jgi:SNF2 family DNA or RNA helicase
MNLYAHQREAIDFLVKRPGALLTLDMGLGKTRCSLAAALQLYKANKIDRVLVLAPAAVRISWLEEIAKLNNTKGFTKVNYNAKDGKFYVAGDDQGVCVCIVSYALLPRGRHVANFCAWCAAGNALLVCDESSWLKNRTAKQTKGSANIAGYCIYRWLLTGTPIANSPLDLYGQALVMSPQNGNGHNYKPNGAGPLKGFGNWYHFRSRYAVLKQMNMGQVRFQQVVAYQNIDELTEKFKPYVLRRTKAECLDLPAKSYTVREIMLSNATWKIYQELRRDALLSLPDEDVRPEPNAAVRILRLAQITSGIVGVIEE